MRNTSLYFDFVCPAWNVVDGAGAAVRLKIENGIVFFKPRLGPVPDLDGSDERKNRDLIGIHEVKMGSEFVASLGRGHPMIGRVIAVLGHMGWSRHQPYFELQTAQRGWLAITLPAIQTPPQVLTHGCIITSETVALVLDTKPYVRVRRVEVNNNKSVFVESGLVDASA